MGRSECNQLIRRWYGQWERVLKIIAIDEHERNSDVIRHIQTPRNLAQLIGRGAVATRMERSGDDAALQRALQHYAHEWSPRVQIGHGIRERGHNRATASAWGGRQNL